MKILKCAMAALAVLLLAALSAAPVQAKKHIALVIGNSAYEAVAKLENPKNDSTDVATSLERLGYQVTLRQDLTYEELRQALREFSRQSQGAERALVFYAGHGIEVEGINYLIPIDAQLRNDLDVQYEAIPLESGLSAVEGATELRMVLLDACRNNPFVNKIKRASGTRSIGRGLARVEPAVGTVVAFAAKEGTTADDGEGRNSPFTAALLNNLEKPGLELNFLFRNVRDEVYQSTRGRQQPFTYGSLPSKQIFLKPALPVDEPAPAGAAMVLPATPPAPVGSNQLAAELLYWNTVKDSNDPDILQSYVSDYPEGKFAGLAKVLIAKLRPSDASAQVDSDEAKIRSQAVAALDSPSSAVADVQTSPKPPQVAALPSDTRIDDSSSVREAQIRLFELNYDPGTPDGKIGKLTAEAIRAFEKDNGLKVAGTLTLGVLEAIRRKPVPGQWGALGFSPATRTIIRTTSAPTRKAAQSDVLARCADCSEVLSFSGQKCASISLSTKGWGWAVRSTLESAQGAANEICAGYGSGCQIKASACAGSGS